MEFKRQHNRVFNSDKEDNDQANRLPCTVCLGYFKGHKTSKHVKRSSAAKEIKETPPQLLVSRALLATNNSNILKFIKIFF